jgi:hypothetical protein
VCVCVCVFVCVCECVCVCVCVFIYTYACVCVCVQNGALCGNPKCKISLGWKDLSKLESIGKVFTGGLGYRATNGKHGEFRLWVCLRDWDWAEMRTCGVGLGQFACFKFEERSREFVHWDSEETLKLISAEKYKESFAKEDANTDHRMRTRGEYAADVTWHDATKCMHSHCRAWPNLARCKRLNPRP